MPRFLILLALFGIIGTALGSPLSPADAIAALLPLAVELGLSEMARTAQAVALAGLTPLAWALHAYLNLDLVLLYGVSVTTFYRTVYLVMESICKHHELPLLGAIAEAQAGRPSRLAALAIGFAHFTDGVIMKCISAIDGVQVRIKKPLVSEVPNPTAYVNRKGFFALNVQACADSTGRITWASIRTPGAVHDAAAYEMSVLFRTIASVLTESMPACMCGAEYTWLFTM
jgi:hypothetical protein